MRKWRTPSLTVWLLPLYCPKEGQEMKRACQAIALVFVAALIASSTFAQTTTTSRRARVTKVDGGDSENPYGGKLYVTINGKRRRIHDHAYYAWSINDGRDVVFSSPYGSGGFENEGQALHLFNAGTRRTKKIMSEYVGVTALQEVKLGNGKTALLVKMGDGGLGASYFAVVDPQRGEVFFRPRAELTRLQGNTITLAFYNEDDWETINEARAGKVDPPDQVISHTQVKPFKTETHDLRKVLRGSVIYNKRYN